MKISVRLASGAATVIIATSHVDGLLSIQSLTGEEVTLSQDKTKIFSADGSRYLGTYEEGI